MGLGSIHVPGRDGTGGPQLLGCTQLPLLLQVKELEEQLSRRPEPEELDVAQAALAMAEDEKLQLRLRLQEAERRLLSLEEEGGCCHPCPTQAGACSGATGMPTAPPAHGWAGLRLRGAAALPRGPSHTLLQWRCCRRSWPRIPRCRARPLNQLQAYHHHHHRCHHLHPLPPWSK